MIEEVKITMYLDICCVQDNVEECYSVLLAILLIWKSSFVISNEIYQAFFRFAEENFICKTGMYILL